MNYDEDNSIYDDRKSLLKKDNDCSDDNATAANTSLFDMIENALVTRMNVSHNMVQKYMKFMIHTINILSDCIIYNYM
jgi:hypothetical protein